MKRSSQQFMFAPARRRQPAPPKAEGRSQRARRVQIHVSLKGQGPSHRIVHSPTLRLRRLYNTSPHHYSRILFQAKNNACFAFPRAASSRTPPLPATRVPAQDSLATLAPQREYLWRIWKPTATDLHERRTVSAEQTARACSLLEARDQAGAGC